MEDVEWSCYRFLYVREVRLQYSHGGLQSERGATQNPECNTCGRTHNPKIQDIETQTSRELRIETLPTPENLA